MAEKGQRADGGVEKSIKRLTSPKMVPVPGEQTLEKQKSYYILEKVQSTRTVELGRCVITSQPPRVSRGCTEGTGNEPDTRWLPSTGTPPRKLLCDVMRISLCTWLLSRSAMWVSGEWWGVIGQWWVHEHFKIKGVRNHCSVCSPEMTCVMTLPPFYSGFNISVLHSEESGNKYIPVVVFLRCL